MITLGMKYEIQEFTKQFNKSEAFRQKTIAISKRRLHVMNAVCTNYIPFTR